jgi:hypothetical protein
METLVFLALRSSRWLISTTGRVLRRWGSSRMSESPLFGVLFVLLKAAIHDVWSCHAWTLIPSLPCEGTEWKLTLNITSGLFVGYLVVPISREKVLNAWKWHDKWNKSWIDVHNDCESLEVQNFGFQHVVSHIEKVKQAFKIDDRSTFSTPKWWTFRATLIDYFSNFFCTMSLSAIQKVWHFLVSIQKVTLRSVEGIQ